MALRTTVLALVLALIASASLKESEAFSLRQLLGRGGGPRGPKPTNGTEPPHTGTHPHPPLNGTWPDFNGTSHHGNHSHPWGNGTWPDFNGTWPDRNGTWRGNHTHPWFGNTTSEVGNFSGHHYHGPANATFQHHDGERGRHGK